MKKWKNWLLPIFTCLVVLCAALLPQRLSELRDRALTYGADGYNRVLDSLERAALSAPDTGSEA